MTLQELLDKEKCTDEETRLVVAYYLALKFAPLIPIIYSIYRTSKLFK